MATTIKWVDNNQIETAHKIYKSSTYFTKDNLPAPLVELGADVTEYEDVNGTNGENWYIVSALLNDYEVFSEPFIPNISTAYIHDVFGDGSIAATYNFDGDVTDLGGSYDGIWSGTEQYSTGVIDQAVSFVGGSNSYIETTGLSLSGFSTFSISFWCNGATYNLGSLLSQGTESPSGEFFIDYYQGAMRFRINIGGLTHDFNFPSGYLDGTWHHFVAIYDGTTVSFLKDNTENGNFAATGTVDAMNGSVIVGNRSAITTGRSMDGSMDQLRIFNRAITQQEVDTLYQERAAYL